MRQVQEDSEYTVFLRLLLFVHKVSINVGVYTRLLV